MKSVVSTILCASILTAACAAQAATTQSDETGAQDVLEFDTMSYFATQTGTEWTDIDEAEWTVVRFGVQAVPAANVSSTQMVTRIGTPSTASMRLLRTKTTFSPDNPVQEVSSLNGQDMLGIATKATILPLSSEKVRAAAAGLGGEPPINSDAVSVSLPAGLPLLIAALAILCLFRTDQQRESRPVLTWTRPAQRIFYRKRHSRTWWRVPSALKNCHA